MTVKKVLIDGAWRDSAASETFTAFNPKTATALKDQFPISTWDDCEAMLDGAVRAFEALRTIPQDQIATFLEKYADRIDARSEEFCQVANEETSLPISPRLSEVELPRTTGQLRQAANAVVNQSWCRATIDTAANIRSYFAPIGPVAVFGPNNFPFAFGSISGGDFAAAIAAGNPVIGKANPMHPKTTMLFAEEALAAVKESGLPDAMVQLIYRLNHDDGERLVRDHRLAAIGYTGSRNAGLKLKAAADAVGKPIYLELSSINPVVILEGALHERGDAIADDFTGSCLLGAGQFCTNPGLVILQSGKLSDQLIDTVSEKFQKAPVGTLFSESGQKGLSAAIKTLVDAGATLVCGGEEGAGNGYSVSNTLLTISAKKFLANPGKLQTEAFGNASLFVVGDTVEEIVAVIKALEGNLTGCVYSDTNGSDDATYDRIIAELRQRVGRVLNDKMPTGVAVSSAMNHGGPFPATGHPGFTAVGMPTSIHRFAMLQCFDNVRDSRLPEILRDDYEGPAIRFVDGKWTNERIASMS
jgi:2,5-dioxopentanoate dehydrogenase